MEEIDFRIRIGSLECTSSSLLEIHFNPLLDPIRDLIGNVTACNTSNRFASCCNRQVIKFDLEIGNISLPRTTLGFGIQSSREFIILMAARVDEWLEALDQNVNVSNKSCSVGVYVESAGNVMVVQQKGNSLRSIGVNEAGKLHLYPEEALMLSQKRVLRVYKSDSLEEEIDPVVLQQQLLAHVDLEAVIVYTYLTCKKYVVRRRLSGQQPTVSRHGELKIAFDVFKLTSNFRKSNPGPPDFQLVICSFQDRIPTVAELRQQIGQSKCVKVAVVDQSNVVLMYDISTEIKI